MATTARPEPYIWVTWLTGLLAGEKQCLFAPWVKAHFRIEKLERGFDLEAWKIEHTDMLRRRARELEAEGYVVSLEDQNAFKLRGQAGTLAGKIDLIAVRGDDVRIVDCKSGEARSADVQQVLSYLFALPLVRPSVRGKRLVGELQYKTRRVEIQPEEFTPALRQRIVDTIKQTCDRARPSATPSAAECRWCDVGPHDCPDRIEQAEPAVVTLEF